MNKEGLLAKEPEVLSILTIYILGLVTAVLIAGAFLFGWYLREHAIYSKAQKFDPSTILNRHDIAARSQGEGELPFMPVEAPEPFAYAGVTDKYEDEVQAGPLTEKDLQE